MARREPERSFSVDSDAGVVVDAVPEPISMVVRNYLSNAVKYSPPGTPIAVRVTTKAGMAVLAVHDAGHGLAPDQAGRVFDAFYRSTAGASTAHAIGIGLTVCRRVVDPSAAMSKCA
jgi:K+-sensing histidine kinase KdpD